MWRTIVITAAGTIHLVTFMAYFHLITREEVYALAYFILGGLIGR